MKQPFLYVLICLMIFLAPVSSNAATYTASVKPWSGYWWKNSKGGLVNGSDYRGLPSPLQKYELFHYGTTPEAVSTWFLQNGYDPSAPSWYGYCHGWANAAIYESFDFVPSVIGDMPYFVGDKKGMLTLMHDNDVVYGGSGSDPAQFHYWLLDNLRDNNRAFAIDIDPTGESWSHPVYSYSSTSTTAGDAKHVKTTIKYASDRVDPDFVGTSELVKSYTYTLFLDGSGAVTSGEWTGFSEEDHPGYMWRPVEPRSTSPLAYESVVQIAYHTGADDAPVSITPGRHRLVADDVESYTCAVENGKSGLLCLDSDKGNTADIAVVITDASGTQVYAGNLTAETVGELVELPGGESYDISVTNTAVDKHDQYLELSFTQRDETDVLFPLLNEVAYWQGFVATNTSSSVLHYDLTAERNLFAGGSTYSSGRQVQAEAKDIFLYRDVAQKTAFEEDDSFLRFSSEDDPVYVALYGQDKKGLATLYPLEFSAQPKVLPETYGRVFGVNNDMATLVVNGAMADNTIRLTSYEASGDAAHTYTLKLGPYERFLFEQGNDLVPDVAHKGWIEMASSDALPFAVAAHYEKSYQKSFEHLPGMATPHDTLYVTLVPGPETEWSATVTLVNPTDNAVSVVMHPEEMGDSTEFDYAFTLAPRERRDVDMQEHLVEGYPTLPFMSVVSVKASAPVYGFMAYETGYDPAWLPLLAEDEFQPVRNLAHFPTDSIWWTGVCLANITDADTQVTVTPVDVDGNMLYDHSRVLSVPHGIASIFSLNQYWAPELQQSFGWIAIESTDDTPFGGFYLYGNHAKTYLSGKNFD